MNKITAAGLLFLFVMPLACGSKGSDRTEPSSPDKTTSSALPVSKSTAIHKNKVNLQQPVTVTGTGITPEHLPLKFNFTISPLDRITGTMQLESKNLKLNGILQKNIVRCWITGTDAADSSLWRGTFTGIKTDDTFTGEFTISNNAAAKTVTGTWKQTKGNR